MSIISSTLERMQIFKRPKHLVEQLRVAPGASELPVPKRRLLVIGPARGTHQRLLLLAFGNRKPHSANSS